MKQLFRTCYYIRSWGYRFANDYMYKDTGLCLYVSKAITNRRKDEVKFRKEVYIKS